MEANTIYNIFAILAFISFLSAVWSEGYRNQFVWTGILFVFALIVVAVGNDENSENEKTKKNKKIDKEKLL